jgi:cardiolipin synthase
MPALVTRHAVGLALKRIALGVIVLAILLFALIGVLTMTRGTPVEYVIAKGDPRGPPSIDDPLFERTIELNTGVHIEPGNGVQVLQNGDGTYPLLWRDIRSCQHTVTVQMYFSKPGKVADSLASVLGDCARRGARVLLLLDGFGSQSLSKQWREGLRHAGVEVALLRKLRWYTLHMVNERSHARVVVVDGRVGYTGGFGLADYWLGGGHKPDEWRETNVRFEGPAVAQLQAAFAVAWAEATGELLTGDAFYPPVAFDTAGSVHAALFHAVPTTGSTPAERFYALTIAGARRSLYISNAYFVPDDDFRRLLEHAAKRGVDVRVLTTGPNTDVHTTLWAGQYRYAELLKAGVRIYEYQPANMHAKTLSADGVWGSVGSMNFDNRSLAFNNETTLLIFDRRIVTGMDSMFVNDLKSAHEVTLAEVEHWSVWRRMRSAMSDMLERVL